MRKCLSETCDLPICGVHFYPMSNGVKGTRMSDVNSPTFGPSIQRYRTVAVCVASQ